ASSAGRGIDLEHHPLDLLANRKALARIGIARQSGFTERHQTGDSGRERYEDPELLVALDFTHQDLPGLEVRGGRRPRILLQLLQPKRDLAVFDTQDLDL